jgi:RNA polymerase primary sigma factor
LPLYCGKVLLRDIIDLDATNTVRRVKILPAPGSDIEAGEPTDDSTPTGHEVVSESDIDEDDMQQWLSISAMEAELKPKVFETFNSIADNFKRLRRLQELNIQGKLKNERLSPAQERKSKEFKKDILTEVKSLRLNQARIDALVEHLNKRLLGYEGQLMRLAELHGVSREGFLRQYQGSELDPRWLNRVSKLTDKGWKNFVAQDRDRIKDLRTQIHTLAAETGLEIAEFRRSCTGSGRASAKRSKRKRRWLRPI